MTSSPARSTSWLRAPITTCSRIASPGTCCLQRQGTLNARRGKPPIPGDAVTKQAFLTDIQTLRKRAREHIDEGAVTPGYDADRKTVLNLLNNALATEIVCVLRYRRHYFMAKGLDSRQV